MLVPFARLLAGLASHPRGRTRFTAIFCGLLGGKSHQRQGKGLRILLSRHTCLHTITDCNTTQDHVKGPGRVREQRTRDDTRVFDDGPWLVVPSPREI